MTRVVTCFMAAYIKNPDIIRVSQKIVDRLFEPDYPLTPEELAK